MSVAISYAKALCEVATEAQSPATTLDRIEAELETIVQLVNTSKELRIILYGPLASAKEKSAVIEAICKKTESPKLVIAFLQLLAKKGRFSELGSVREAFSQLRVSAGGGIAGTLVTAVPMAPADVEELARIFSKKLEKNVSFKVSMDSSLLAGVKAHVAGVMYDGSLRSELERLRDRLTI